MGNKFSLKSILLLLVFAFLVNGCGNTVEQRSSEPLPTPNPSPSPSPSQPQSSFATPTVDIDHAWQVCKSGGELTYEEAIAIRTEFATEENWGWMLEKCKLKESFGWVAGWSHEHDTEYKIIPNKYQVAVYVYNPYAGLGRELMGSPPEMLLVTFSDEEVAQLTVGRRIRFSGNLLLVNNTVAVENPKYSLLEDEPAVPRPTADDIKDIEIRLDRTMCFGACPDYTLTITSDGKVTFEGRHHTRVKGTETTTIDRAKLEELVMEVQKADFFGLLDEYSAIVTDHPTYTLSVRLGGKSKTVSNYATGPHRLYLLQDRIDQIVNSAQWIKCDIGPCP
jgi:hypothetical protein